MNRGRGKERGVDLAVALAVQSLAMAVFVRQWCCFKRWRERPFFSSPLFSFFLFCCVSHHLFIISVSSFFSNLLCPSFHLCFILFCPQRSPLFALASWWWCCSRWFIVAASRWFFPCSLLLLPGFISPFVLCFFSLEFPKTCVVFSFPPFLYVFPFLSSASLCSLSLSLSLSLSPHVRSLLWLL